MKNLISDAIKLSDKEKNVLKQLQLFPYTIQQAAANYSPALIANYTYDLVKEFNLLSKYFNSWCRECCTNVF